MLTFFACPVSDIDAIMVWILVNTKSNVRKKVINYTIADKIYGRRKLLVWTGVFAGTILGGDF